MLTIPFWCGARRCSRTLGYKYRRERSLLDVTNALTEDMQLASDCTTSGAEHLQQVGSGTRVVKAFNTQFAGHMDSGRLDTGVS